MKLWKNFLLSAFAVGAAALAATSFAAGISGTPHDFSGGSYGNTTGQICVPCHVPHGAAANSAPTNNVMWNHAINGTKSYVLYSGSAKLDNTSRLCLSCHDGVFGVDNWGGTYAVSTNNHTVANYAVIGVNNNDLSHEHPIGAVYRGLSATTGVFSSTSMRDPTVATGFQGGFGPTGYTLPLALGYTGSVPDAFAVYVGCNTCHNPHDNSKSAFLRGINDKSYLCLTCHIK